MEVCVGVPCLKSIVGGRSKSTGKREGEEEKQTWYTGNRLIHLLPLQGDQSFSKAIKISSFFFFCFLLFSRLYSLPIYQASLLCFLARLSSDLIWETAVARVHRQRYCTCKRGRRLYLPVYYGARRNKGGKYEGSIKATISHTKETISADKEECPRASESIILDRNKLFPFMFTLSSWGAAGSCVNETGGGGREKRVDLRTTRRDAWWCTSKFERLSITIHFGSVAKGSLQRERALYSSGQFMVAKTGLFEPPYPSALVQINKRQKFHRPNQLHENPYWIFLAHCRD